MGIVYQEFESPIIKPLDEIEPGDIFRTEYGDYNNWVTVSISSIEKSPDGFIKTIGKFVSSGNDFTGYSFGVSVIEIIGKEIK